MTMETRIDMKIVSRMWPVLALLLAAASASSQEKRPIEVEDQFLNIETPTLVMGGEDDWNVPILNSEQLYQALRRRGVPTQLVVYPGQSHGIRVPSYQVDRYQRYLSWYDKWVKGTGKPVTEEGI